MIKKIEEIRSKQKPFLSKAKLAKESGISKSMYYRYVDNNNAPYKVVERMLKVLGLKLVVVLEV